ncbi:MAG: SlyX family protein [Pseudomonadota bacterium]
MTESDSIKVALEMRIAFLDQSVADLTESVDAHQRQILALEQRCELLMQKLSEALASINDTGGASAGDIEIPPHY